MKTGSNAFEELDASRKKMAFSNAQRRLSAPKTFFGLRSAGVNRILSQLGLIFAGLLILFPIYWIVNLSFQTIEQITAWSPYWFPIAPTLSWFQAVFSKANLIQPLMNTVIVSLLSTICVLFLSITAAYPLARLRFPGRRLLFTIIISTMMIPEQVLLIPRYMMTYRLGLLNTYAGLFVPYLGWPFGLFLLTQFMGRIPKELEESAKMDGANYLHILWSIILPLCTGPLVTLGVIEFLGNWNFFQWPLIVINDDSMRTLAIAVFFLQGKTRGAADVGMIFVGAIFCILPVLVIYLFFQRHIVGSLGQLQMKG